jgi:hypothetical protein
MEHLMADSESADNIHTYLKLSILLQADDTIILANSEDKLQNSFDL